MNKVKKNCRWHDIIYINIKYIRIINKEILSLRKWKSDELICLSRLTDLSNHWETTVQFRKYNLLETRTGWRATSSD